MAERQRRRKGLPAAAKAAKAAPPLPARPFSAREQALLFGGQAELSGSASGAFTYGLYRQAVRSLCHNARDDPETVEVARIAARRFLAAVAPRDPVEGMMAAQLLALHDAAMECFRRGAMREQPGEYRDTNLTQANRLVRSYAVLVEALDRRRGRGRPQVVRVERVTVNAGGQAIVGAVAQGGGGMEEKATDDPMHLALWRMNRARRCGARTRSGSPCRSPAVRGKGRCRMRGGAAGSGAPPGNRNALRHGCRPAGAVATRRLAGELAREARRLVGLVR